MRSHAERLLADIRDLGVGDGKWENIQQFAQRWRKFRIESGTCTKDSCRVEVVIDDLLADSLWRMAEKHPCLYIIRGLYTIFDPRTPRIQASVGVRNSAITESRFDLFVEGPSGGSPDFEGPYGLFGIATETAQGFGPYIEGTRKLHPDYWIGKPGGCEGCIKLQTAFTPAVGRAKILELTEFNFDCITGWSSCATETDIMPAAGREFAQEQNRSRTK